MKRLRKLIGSKMNFKYVAEYVDLLPNKETESYIEDLDSAKTKARRSEGLHAFEYYNDTHKIWMVISDIDYYRIIHKHKNPPVIRRRKGTSNEKKTLYDIFILKDHFVERMKERFVNSEEAIPPILMSLIDNGYYIQEGEFPNQLETKANKHSRFFLFEPDFSMLCVAELHDNKIRLVTTYDPGSIWFDRWRKAGNLKQQVTMKEFIRRMHE